MHDMAEVMVSWSRLHAVVCVIYSD
jgi:hypothetical protein